MPASGFSENNGNKAMKVPYLKPIPAESRTPAGPAAAGRILVVALCLLLLIAVPLRGQEGPDDALSGPALDLKTSLDETLQTVKEQRDQLKAEQEQARRSGRALASELAAYRIQLSSYGNLAVLPSVRPETLAKALAEQRQSAEAVRASAEQIAARRKELGEQRAQIEQQLTVNQTQLGELKKMAAPPPQGAKWLERLAAVVGIQKEILSLIDKMDALYAGQAAPLETVAKDLAGLAGTLEATLEQARRTAVFTRGENPISKLDRAGLVDEARRLGLFCRSLGKLDFWRVQARPLVGAGYGPLLTAVVLGIGLLLVLLRLRAALRRLAGRTDAGVRPWGATLLAMLQRTVLPLGLMLFFTVKTDSGGHSGAASLPGAVIAFLWVWLAGDWMRHFFVLAPPVLAPPRWSRLSRTGCRLVRVSRTYAAVHIFLTWSIGAAGMLEALARLALEVALVAGIIVFWRRWREEASDLPEQPAATAPAWKFQAAMVASYAVVLAGPVLDLAGYGALALYWYCGWGLTLVAVLWSALIGQSLREIDRTVIPVAEGGAPQARAPLKWALLRLAWLAWALFFLSALALAWGGWESLESGLGQALSHPFQIGGTTFRLSGALLGVMVLFFTHLAVRLWRVLLQGRVLAQSGLTHGARDSIITISGYLIWAVGILIALNALGISTTSLTVVFGALGIGLGFGLQNIFNNFVSGLILLFERPIQVGDDIEINGIWAKVMQINVRATVVKTYDNAALIIPNSEFISNQVTNWSHKDSRLRRNINVGVAYGSDTELVRGTLLEAAANTAGVSPHPRPDVLFTDFGESTLNFRLRVWTTINSMVVVDTALRFEIDRLFRLRGIEMAFPQRDIYIRGVRGVEPIPISAAPETETGGSRKP